jgi:hypothetical protein
MAHKQTVRNPDPSVCRSCDQKDHEGCTGRPQGRRFQDSREVEHLSCACAKKGHPETDECRNYKYENYGSSVCIRPVKEVVVEYHGNSISGQREVEVGRCGIHAAAVKRVKANNEKYQQEREAARERSERTKQAEQAAEETLERIQEKLVGLDIRPETVTVVSSRDGKVGIRLPAEALETLVDMAEQWIMR